MARFFIDEREVEIPSGCSSLYQILNDLESVLSPNRAIKQIKIDGLPFVTAVAQATIPFWITDQCERIEIFTDSISQIACTSISDAIQYIDQIEAISPYFTTDSQDSGDPGASKKLKVMVEVFYWLDALIQKLERYFRKDAPDGEIGFGCSRPICAALEKAKKLQERGEPVPAGELIREDILALVPVFKGRLQRLSLAVNL